ncbi:activity-regulated cytoskeleton associated protein 2-like, partial [Bombyx mandarina]|uniref:Activity-regulated cytoskeleton associated protein 2-like n=1 Tax=Bombyx mandarina TaxID=7092 RepID=A0A6J2KJU8_BOMMA
SQHKSSFARCTKRYDGERNHNKVEEFITNITIYKKIEKITDEDALEGLTLLLTGQAATWWSGVKGEIKKWNPALDAIRSAFAPKMQPHEVYLELFAKKQTNETIDAFVCDKRALLSHLPAKRHKEEEELDFVYGLLNIRFKKEIPRYEIKSFSELLERGRHIENLAKEAEEIAETSLRTGIERKQPKRCSYCGKKGHFQEVCRKRLSEEAMGKNKSSSESVQISCYGCGVPGVFRSNCKTCKNNETPPNVMLPDELK